jgi:DNA-binding HxlR family transcriptional regulator
MKGQRTNLANADCAIARALQIIGDWWSLLIVRDAFRGKERFCEFQKSLGLARNILTVRLRKLVDEGIFRIESDADSAFHRYILTKKGEQLSVVLMALWQWGEQSCFRRGELKYAMVDKRDEEPVAKLELKARNGRVLSPRDFHLVPKGKGVKQG